MGGTTMTGQWHLRGMLIFLVASSLIVSGCANTKELERINKEQADTINSLANEVSRLNDELATLRKSSDELADAKAELEEKLRSEVGEGGLSVRMSDRGLVVTLLDRILFDSGKAELKSSAQGTLDKVVDVILQTTPTNKIFVEGHTDADPIRYSGYRSNWELSAARALEVVHYFVDQRGLEPKQMVASGYGEFNPVAPNNTKPNKAQNRRVEILISPKKISGAEPVPQAVNPSPELVK